MTKRSRLRTGPAGKGRFALYLVLAGCLLLLGFRYFKPIISGESGLPFVAADAPESLLEARGTIFDRNFKELAITQERVSVYAYVGDVDPDKVANALSPILDISPQSLKTMIMAEPYRAWLAKSISKEEEMAVIELGLAGIHLHREKVRYYPEKETAAHLLGYVGKSMGLAGIEHSYDALLNIYGSADPLDGEEYVTDQTHLAAAGKYLVLSLDLKIQKILEKFVTEQGRKGGDGKSAAMLMECATGKIIGAAHYPSYDPNIFHEYGREQLENILTQPTLIPLPVRELMWQASLEQAQFEEYQAVLPWSIHSGDRRLGSQLRLWDRLGLNDGFKFDFTTSERHAPDQRFMPIEGGNYYDSIPETATPLHIATIFNNLIKRGSRVIPRVIDRIAPREGYVINVPAAAGEETVAPVVAGELLNMLDKQMQAGPISSGILQMDTVSFTESASVRQYWGNRMLFAAIPRQEPRLMLFVFTPLPVFSPSPVKTESESGLEEATRRMILPMVALQEVMSNLSDMISVEEKKQMNFEIQQKADQVNVINPVDKAEAYHTMPDLKGLSLRKCLRLLNDLKLEIQISGTGVVVEQKPRAGEMVKQGELCRLVLKTH